jgi:IclR family acetate operon transcriptional repressor
VRSLRLLEALADTQSASLVDLAAAAQLSPSTAHRLLGTLVAEGYAGRSEDDQHYRLGYRVPALARSAETPLQDLRDAARPVLTRLRDAFGETANLVVLDGPAIVYVEQVESERAVRMFSRIGNRVAAHASGGGKALLASLPSERLDQLLGRQPLAALTPQTLTERPALDAELADIRDRGWAIDDREYDEDVVCVAAAITESSDVPAAAITVSGPVERMRTHDLATLGQEVAAAAQDVRRSLR